MSCNDCTVPGLDSSDTVCAAANVCGCGGSTPPYYNQASPVQETHCQAVTQIAYDASLSVSVSFVMPACNLHGLLTIPGLRRLQIGSYLWNAVYGYLLVIGFDPISQQVQVTNECTAGNAAPGTVIPACTLWNVVGPP